MTNSQLVSVIITTYKRNFDMVLRAIKSVQNQTYRNLEIIVVDDNENGSPYRVEIESGLKNLDDTRIVIIQHKANQGACAARNNGIINSHGDYVAFLDDDDEWLPTKVELQIGAFKENPKLGLVYCQNYNQVGNSAPILGRQKILNGYRYKELLFSNFIPLFVMIKREVFEDIGLFNIEMKSAQDAELWLRIAKKYEIYGVPQPLAIYHHHGNERISTSPLKKIEGLEMLNSIFWNDIKKDFRILSRRLIVLAPYYQIRDGYWKGVSHSIKSFLIFPFSISSLKIVINTIIYRYKNDN